MFSFGIKQRVVALASAILTISSTLVFLPVTQSAEAAAMTSCSSGIGTTGASYATVTTTTTSCTIKFLQANTWTVPEGLTSIAAAVVGGGGGGGFGSLAGGGGGGEVMFNAAAAVTPGATTSIAVGAGGSQGFINSSTWVGGGRGGTSSLGAIYAGGGYGGVGNTDISNTPSSTYGGSGGGQNMNGTTAMAAVNQNIGGGWTSYARNGGLGAGSSGGGGGGGAGAVGGNASGGAPGAGGNGITLPSPLSSFTLAGGGGGWNNTPGAGGTGGGGTGNASTTSLAASASGTANTGGGGGAGGPGGTGVVIVQFSLPPLSFATTTTTFGSGLTLATTGGAGTGAVTYAVNSAGTAGCSITAGVLNFTNSGTCTVTATKAADATFASTTTGVTTFTINPAAALTPALGSPTFSAGIWTIPVTNYDANFTWGYSASNGGSVVAGTPSGSNVVLTVTPVAGSTSAVTITTTRAGYTSGTATSTAYYQGCASTSVTTGAYTAVKFTATGTCNYIAPVGTKYDYLVLAGGGAGGQRAGGGGGAGGYLTSVGTPASRLDLTTSQVLQITVGAGGSGGSAANSYKGANGADSVLVASSTLTAKGGGGGATGYNTNTAPFDGFSGGSGGGAVGAGAVGTATGTPSTQGNSGGLGSNGGAAMAGWTGGGGGGAGSAGVAGSTSGVAGNGGAGLSNSITGMATCYAAGGGGGAYVGYTAGTGGACSGTLAGGAGSAGDSIAATTAAANTGSGGGGAGFTNTSAVRGDGGSGIVVLRYITSANTPTLGSLTVSGSGFTVPVTNYDANFAYSCNITCTQSAGTITVASIPGGTTSFTVTATGPTGATFSGTSTAINTPGTPTGLAATSGNGKASIAFTAGANGGSAITNYKYSTDGTTYTALATPATSSPITIPGLTNGTTYTIYLKAVNALGDSVASSSVQVVVGTLFDLQGGNYNASTGVWSDVSANNDTPTLLRTTTPAAGTSPNSVAFTGSSGAAQFVSGQSLTSVGAFTQSVWFKTNSSGKLVGLENVDATSATGGTGYDRHLYVGTDGYLYFGVYNGQTYVIKSTALVNDNTWKFATATFDGSNMKLYINGSLVASGTGSASTYTGNFRVGGYKNGGWTSGVDGYFNGSISRVAVYLYAQTSAQVTTAYGWGQAAQTVTFTQPTTRTVTSGSFTVAPTASTGLTVTVTSNSTSICTVSGLTVTLVSAGTCSLTATQAGDPFNASASSTQTFTVSPVAITFNANGGTGTTTALSVTSASGNAISANGFSKTGYTFNGWNIAANGTGTAYAAGANIALAADTTLYAQWFSQLILDFDATDINSWTGGTTLTNRNSNYPNATLSSGTTGVAVTNSGQTMNFAGGNPVSSPISSTVGPYGTLNSSISTSLFQSGMTVDIYGSMGSTANNWERFLDFGKNKGSAADASYNLMVGRFTNTTSIGIGLFNQTSGTATPGWCNTATWALDSNPHRFTFVLNGTSCAIYVDGVQQNVRLEWGTGASTIAYGLPTNGISWDMDYIGRSNWTGDTSFEGSIRSIRLFGNALTPTAIDGIDSARLVNKTVSFSSTASTTAMPSSVLTTGTITLPSTSAATRTGYTLSGWYTDSALTTLAGNPGTSYTPNTSGTTTLYAAWTGNTQTVTYALNGGTGTVPTQTGAQNGGTFTVASGSGITKAGYTFAGWSDGTSTYQAGSTYTVGNVNVTLTAQWTAGTFTLTYNYNGATGGNGTATSSYTTGGTAITLPTPTKTGYVFGGWYAEAGLTTSITGPYSPSADATIYAKWNNGTYTLTYNYNGATGGNSTATSSFTTNGTPITLPTPTKTGYVFAGWYAEAGLTTAVTGAQSPTASATIYAKWTAGTYTVTYNYNGATGANSTATDSFTTGATAITLPTPTKTGYVFGGWYAEAGLTTSITGPYSPTADATIYAKWNNGTYTLTYNYNGATGGNSTATSSFTTNGTAITLPTPTKTGYVFAGWFAESALTTSVTGTQLPTADATLYAKWTNGTYTLTYNYNGATGSNSTASDSFTTNGTAITLPAPTKTGYVFAGWYSDAGLTAAVTGAQSPTASSTLYAKWTAGTYVITYNYNGATGGNSSATDSYTTGGATLTLPTPTKTGYVFGGWHAEAGLTAAVTGPLSPSADATIYAKWNNGTYTLTYTYNGATSGAGVTSDSFTTGGTAITLPTPSKTGYVFAGWFADSGFTTAVTGTQTPTASATIYAKWTAGTFTLTYTYNGATGGNGSATSSYTTGGTAITLPTPTRTGYTFAGWFSDAGLTTAVTGTQTPSSDETIYAKWTAVNYSLTYNSNSATSGSVPTDAANYNIGNSASVAGNTSNMVRTGYTFGGWTLASNGNGTVYNSGDALLFAAGNQTLYAKWTANTYTITYNANGATGTQANASDSYTTAGTAVTLSAVGTMSKTGHTFSGWSTSANGTAIVGTFTTAADATLYAVWTVNVITVTYSKGAASTASFISFPANTSGNYGTRVTISNSVDSSVTFNGSTYSFVGWSDGTSMYQTGEQYLLSVSNVTLTAIWVQAFGVRYIFNGGTPANGTSAIDAECLVVGNLCTDQQRVTANAAPTRPGYTFTGWTDQSGTAIAASSSFTVNINSYLLYAGWQAINYTVTYAPAGGATTPTQAALNYGDTFTLANAITRTGYNFAGWSDGTNVYGAAATYTVGLTAITLTAQWTPKTYLVSYDWNGGTGSSVANVSYTVGNTGLTLALVGDHVKDGYQFGGWSLTRDGDGVTTPFVATGNTVLYAIWGAGSYSITLDQNYGAQINNVVTVANGSATTLPTPTRSNFVFDGWYTASTGGTKIGNGGASYTPSGSRQLYAQWIQSSLYGVIGNLNRISAITASNGVDSTYSGTNGGSGVSVTVPRGALPAGTLINLDLITDNTYAQSLLTGTNNYILSLAVSWLATDGTVPNTTGGSSISLTITNSAIRAGALIYSVQNGTATLLGTAVANGTLTVELTSDPSLYVVQTVANAPISVTTTVTANSATVTWQAPTSDGGAAITGYSVTLDNGATCTTTLLTCTFNNLVTGTNYTATVVATNSVGTSATAAAAFTPVAPVVVAPTPAPPIVIVDPKPPVVVPPTPEEPKVPTKPVVVLVPPVQAVAKVLENNVPVLNGTPVVKPVQFGAYSAKLDAADVATLRTAVRVLQGKRGTLLVTGFVKYEGKVTPAIKALAVARAKTVAHELAKLGIKVKIGYMGYGPLNTKSPKATDRKVELRWVEAPSATS